MREFIELDTIDRRILRALQLDARRTYDALGADVGLSASAVLRRVKRLEESGVIKGIVARVVPARMGLTLTAYLNVRLHKQATAGLRQPTAEFRAAVQAWPEVIDCMALAGEMDYLLRVVVVDMAHYARFITDTLLTHPSVQDCRTSFVLEQVKADAPYTG
jgi:Lrp/AsnC family leucine-responsive transcriptional regulator